MTKERRMAPRAKARLVVRVQAENRAWMERFTEDLSRGGTFVETDSPLSIGTLVKLVLVLPLSDQAHREIEIEASVAHHRPRMQGTAAGMGIEFIEFSLEDRKAVVAYVDSNLKS